MVFPLLSFSYTSVMRPSVTRTSPTTTGRWYSNSCSPCSTNPPWAIRPPITFMTAPLSASGSGGGWFSGQVPQCAMAKPRVGGSVGGGGADKRPAEEVADLIRSRGGEAVANYEDVADWKGAQSLIQQAVDAFGRLDVLVNNAGILRDKMMFSMTEDDFDSVIRVHLKGTFSTP